jgi:hypothetical protein
MLVSHCMRDGTVTKSGHTHTHAHSPCIRSVAPPARLTWRSWAMPSQSKQSQALLQERASAVPGRIGVRGDDSLDRVCKTVP